MTTRRAAHIVARMRQVYSRARRMLGRVLRAVPEPLYPLDMELGRPWLRHLGIRTVLDVGANEGQFAETARRVFPDSRIISFEPMEKCFRALRARFVADPRFEAHQFALGSSDGTATFHANDFSPSSSLLPMLDLHRDAFPFTQRTTAIEVPVRTLDGLLRGRELDDPVFLKIDVQGYEARVLAGASETLRRCHMILTEVSVEKLYEGEPLAHEIIAWLASAGFRLVGAVDFLRHPGDGRTLQMDLLFARS